MLLFTLMEEVEMDWWTLLFIIYYYIFPRMLFGERPYWWIGESRLFVNKPPHVQQFSSTCETGPGEKPLKTYRYAYFTAQSEL